VTRLRIGLSTCPNDTFLFAPLMAGAVDRRDLELEFVLGDVQELNEALEAGALDVSKASFATALALADRYGVLGVGAAMGFGVGPVLLSGRPEPPGPSDVVLCPGEGTTATLLMGCLHPELPRLEQRRFDEIMPALARGEAAAGVCIHEGRFTYRDRGLRLVEDLGASWERTTGLPVPLGGLLCRLDLDRSLHARVTTVLRASLDAARARPQAGLETMRRHAQEMSDDVIWRHVELYVNDHTRDLGDLGRRAIDELARRSGTAAAPRILEVDAGT